MWVECMTDYMANRKYLGWQVAVDGGCETDVVLRMNEGHECHIPLRGDENERNAEKCAEQ